MVLTLNVGNTHITMGSYENDKLLFSARLRTDPVGSSDEYAIKLEDLLRLNGRNRADVDGAILGSVVPVLTGPLLSALHKLFSVKVLTVGPGLKSGLQLCIDNPAQLGSDLVVGAVAAIEEYPCPLVVVDLGTATTFTVVNEKKQVMGGMIMPGVGVALDAMISRTSQLPKISLDPPKKFIGSNTVDCMKSGVLYGNAACVDGMIGLIEEELGQQVSVVATGGMARYIAPYCRRKLKLDDALLLKGLKLIYRRNQ